MLFLVILWCFWRAWPLMSDDTGRLSWGSCFLWHVWFWQKTIYWLIIITLTPSPVLKVKLIWNKVSLCSPGWSGTLGIVRSCCKSVLQREIGEMKECSWSANGCGFSFSQPWTHCVEQASLKHRDPSASRFHVLGFKDVHHHSLMRLAKYFLVILIPKQGSSWGSLQILPIPL